MLTLVATISIFNSQTNGPHRQKDALKKCYENLKHNTRVDVAKEKRSTFERLNVLYEKNWTKLVTEQLKRFERTVVETAKSEGNLDPPGPKWTFAGSLLYSVTLLTTVGYGSLIPKTPLGKIAAILYAIFGVPLMLILLSLLGSVLAECLRKGYVKFCCHQGEFRKDNANNPNVEYHKAAGSPKGNHYCKNILEDTASIQLLPTSGHNTPNHVNYNQNHRTNYNIEHYEVPKRAILATVRPSRSRGRCRQQGQVRQILTDPMCPTHSHAHNHSSPMKNSIVGISTEVYLEEGEDLEGDIGNCIQHDTPSRIPLIWRPPDKSHSMENIHDSPPAPSVPSLIVLSLFFTYIALGALYFSKLSGWTFLDAVYFCFLALSTIGVGDSVPISTIHSTSTADWQSQLQICACCVYIFVGLVVVATCFSLVQEEVAVKCRQWAHSMGLGRA